MFGRTERPGRLTNSSIDVWFAPQFRSAVIEDVEVVCVVPFLLDYLQLNVGVIQSLVVRFGAGFWECEACAGEEVGNLFRPEPVGVVEFGLRALVLGQGIIVVLTVAFSRLDLGLCPRLQPGVPSEQPIGGMKGSFGRFHAEYILNLVVQSRRT